MKKNHLVGGYEGFRLYDLAKTGDGGKKGEDEGKGGWNEGFAIAPEWGTNCFPQQNSTRNPPFDSALFETTCKEYFHAIQELGRYVLGMMAEGLGVERDFFEPFLNKQNSFCRLTHYYQEKDEVDDINGNDLAPDQDEVEVGAAPHTAWGALTLLIQDTIGGLQVFDRAKEEWHDVCRLCSLSPTLTGVIGSPFTAWYWYSLQSR
jgi:isopenicillin N synthase-like dioxygenase